MRSRLSSSFFIVVTMIWFLGLSLAADSDVANTNFCPLNPKSSIESELEDLYSEVNRMNAYVRDFAKPEQSPERLFDRAYKAICSELKQNASRLRLRKKAGKKSKPAYDKIKPLIDQILTELQDFIIDPSAAVENAPKLAKTITAIRAKAKPLNAELMENAGDQS
ncbi:secreted protein [Melampsora americana]|nr:secreted protein [Melampsora americana]